MELRLSLIRSPHYPDTINVDEDLQDYFSEPRRVKLNEQILIKPLLQPGRFVSESSQSLWDHFSRLLKIWKSTFLYHRSPTTMLLFRMTTVELSLMRKKSEQKNGSHRRSPSTNASKFTAMNVCSHSLAVPPTPMKPLSSLVNDSAKC